MDRKQFLAWNARAGLSAILIGSWAPKAAATVTNPSGIPCPTADLPGWKHVFADDFTTDCPLGAFPRDGITNPATPAAVAAKWTSYPDNYQVTRKNVGGYYRSAETVSIANSQLQIHMHYDANALWPDGVTKGVYCCAAPIPKLFPAETTRWKSSSLYGRYEVCLKQLAPSGTYKIAWLLWPDSGGNSLNGEIDCPELNLDEKTDAHGFIHHAPSSSQGQTYVDMGAKLDSWHTYTIEWSPAGVWFYTDGVRKGGSTTNLPATRMHWILQSELVLGTLPLSKMDQVTLECDWVSFWSRAA
jgi:hypothetical protein